MRDDNVIPRRIDPFPVKSYGVLRLCDFGRTKPALKRFSQNEPISRTRPMFPISDSAPRAARPAITYGLILINSFVFLWMWSLPARAMQLVTIQYALIPLRYSDPAGARAVGLDPDDWWPFLTNTFMHGGWLHLILNMETFARQWFLSALEAVAAHGALPVAEVC